MLPIIEKVMRKATRAAAPVIYPLLRDRQPMSRTVSN